jgi:hypothetical protein
MKQAQLGQPIPRVPPRNFENFEFFPVVLSFRKALRRLGPRVGPPVACVFLCACVFVCVGVGVGVVCAWVACAASRRSARDTINKSGQEPTNPTPDATTPQAGRTSTHTPRTRRTRTEQAEHSSPFLPNRVPLPVPCSRPLVACSPSPCLQWLHSDAHDTIRQHNTHTHRHNTESGHGGRAYGGTYAHHAGGYDGARWCVSVCHGSLVLPQGWERGRSGQRVRVHGVCVDRP